MMMRMVGMIEVMLQVRIIVQRKDVAEDNEDEVYF